MPQIEDLPVPAQKQIRAQRGEQPAESHNETKRRTLLERLAAFGVSRHEEPSTPARRETKMPLQVQAPRVAQPSSVHAEYAKRGVAPSAAVRHGQQSLDAQGRIVPRGIEEDQLEIPAFLRRQSS
jgi:cell division protein FtsZ